MFEGKTILIADDEESNYLYLSAVLRKLKLNIIVATTGAQAIELCKKHPEIDLIFMDIQMPDGNGYQAFQKIRLFRPDLPIIALTAFIMSDDQNKVLYFGFNGYYSKPILMETIKDIVSTYIPTN